MPSWPQSPCSHAGKALKAVGWWDAQGTGVGRRLLGAVERREVMEDVVTGSFVHPGLPPVLGMRQSMVGHQR